MQSQRHAQCAYLSPETARCLVAWHTTNARMRPGDKAGYHFHLQSGTTAAIITAALLAVCPADAHIIPRSHRSQSPTSIRTPRS